MTMTHPSELRIRQQYFDRAAILHRQRRHSAQTLVCEGCLRDQAIEDLIVIGVLKRADPRPKGARP